jgi:hypothetical protein
VGNWPAISPRIVLIKGDAKVLLAFPPSLPKIEEKEQKNDRLSDRF